MIKNTKYTSIIPIVKQTICPQSIVYTDAYQSYNSLTAEGFEHERMNHSKELVLNNHHINGIPTQNFHLYLKESAWNLNNPCLKKRLRQKNHFLITLSGLAPKKIKRL